MKSVRHRSLSWCINGEHRGNLGRERPCSIPMVLGSHRLSGIAASEAIEPTRVRFALATGHGLNHGLRVYLAVYRES